MTPRKAQADLDAAYQQLTGSLAVLDESPAPGPARARTTRETLTGHIRMLDDNLVGKKTKCATHRTEFALNCGPCRSEQLATAPPLPETPADARQIDARKLGEDDPTRPSEEDTEPVHGWFGLSYANYLTLPRSLMQSMPQPWQAKLVALLEEFHTAYRHLEWPDYNVEAGKWCYISDLDDGTIDALGITSECAGLSVAERKHDPAECFPGECRYYNRHGDEIDHRTACVFLQFPDPMPHYNRGRTHVPRADELAPAVSA